MRQEAAGEKYGVRSNSKGTGLTNDILINNQSISKFGDVRNLQRPTKLGTGLGNAEWLVPE